MKNKVLIYGLEDEKERRLHTLAAAQEIDVRRVWPGETDRRLLELLQDSGEMQMPGEDGDDIPEVMVMALESRSKMEAFVDSLRADGIRIPLKAVLTVHNGFWTLKELARELQNEHAKMMVR